MFVAYFDFQINLGHLKRFTGNGFLKVNPRLFGVFGEIVSKRWKSPAICVRKRLRKLLLIIKKT